MTNNTEQRESREAEALRLADWLDLKTAHWHPNENKAADMLRALVADLAAARAEIDRLMECLAATNQDRDALQAMVHDAGREAAAARAEVAALKVPLSDEQIEPMFRARQQLPATGIKDEWYWYAWGVEDGRLVEAKRNEVAAPQQENTK